MGKEKYDFVTVEGVPCGPGPAEREALCQGPLPTMGVGEERPLKCQPSPSLSHPGLQVGGGGVKGGTRWGQNPPPPRLSSVCALTSLPPFHLFRIQLWII